MRVMLIDDSKTMRNIEKSVLAQLGDHEFEEASEGHDALSKIGAFEPDLILVDWHLKDMDGLTFVQRFRQTNQHTPVIMVTTETEKSRVIDAIKAGVNNFVIKPFTPDILSQRIDETLNKHAPPRSSTESR